MIDKRALLRYNWAMEEEKSVLTDDLAVTVGKNIMRLRRMANMTQLDLAEKLNYSDKSISKWEQGNGMPDVRILVRLAELFNVSLDDLVRDHPEKQIVPKKTKLIRRIIIIACSVGLCGLVATVLYVLLGIFVPAIQKDLWLAFLYAVPVSSIVVLVFSSIWNYRAARVVSLSVLIWTLLACVYLTAFLCGYRENMWLLFLIGVPLQILTLFFFVWWKGAKISKE